MFFSLTYGLTLIFEYLEELNFNFQNDRYLSTVYKRIEEAVLYTYVLNEEIFFRHVESKWITNSNHEKLDKQISKTA